MQLAPVMFVAGLDSAATQQRRPHPVGTSPSPPAATSSSPPQPGSATTNANAGTSSGNKPERDPFAVLAARVRDALASQRRPAVWAPEAVRKGKIFQVMFVDKVRDTISFKMSSYLILLLSVEYTISSAKATASTSRSRPASAPWTQSLTVVPLASLFTSLPGRSDCASMGAQAHGTRALCLCIFPAIVRTPSSANR